MPNLYFYLLRIVQNSLELNGVMDLGSIFKLIAEIKNKVFIISLKKFWRKLPCMNVNIPIIIPGFR